MQDYGFCLECKHCKKIQSATTIFFRCEKSDSIIIAPIVECHYFERKNENNADK